MPEFVLLVLARLLLKMIQFVPHGLERAEPRVGDRLINVILARTMVSYSAGCLQVGNRVGGALARLLQDICSKITTLCVPWFAKAEPKAGNSSILA